MISDIGDVQKRSLHHAPRIEKKFPFAASARISLSSVSSDTARRRRLFSISSSLSRFHLIALQATVLVAPSIVRDFRHADYHVCYVPSRLKSRPGRTTVRIAQQNLLVFR